MAPPSGLDQIRDTFGDCNAPDFEAKNIVLFELPYPLVYGNSMTRRSRCHRLMVPIFQAVLADLKAEGLSERVTHYGGIYNKRPIRGGSRPSTHSWGIAIDVNPHQNLLGTPGRMRAEVVQLFAQHGFTWGGLFRRQDPMHFQYATGY
jgi:hypothetical protein